MTVAEPVPKRCPVCTEVLPAGAMKCKACGAFHDWTAQCGSCGTPVSATASVCHECGRFPRNERRCVSCRRPMDPDARTCGGCGAVQGFRGYLNISQTTLSLVVAIISSLTALGAVMTNLWSPRSERHVYFQALASNQGEETDPAERRRFWVLVTNTGKRPVGVRGARLHLTGSPKPIAVRIVRPEVENRSVEKGESLMVELELPGWSPEDYSLSSRTDPKFAAFLNNGHGLDVTISGYGEGGREVKRIEGMPPSALAALLCQSASALPGEAEDPCLELFHEVLEGV